MYDYYEMIRQQQLTNTKLDTINTNLSTIITNQNNIILKQTSINSILGSIIIALMIKIIWDFIIRCWK